MTVNIQTRVFPETLQGRIWKVPAGQSAPMVQQGVIFTPDAIKVLQENIDFTKVECSENKTYRSYTIDGILQFMINKKSNIEDSGKTFRIYIQMNLVSIDLLRHLLKQPVNKPYTKAWLPMLETGKMKSISLNILFEPIINFKSPLQIGENYYQRNLQVEKVKSQIKNYGFAFTFRNGSVDTQIRTQYNDQEIDIINTFFSKLINSIVLEVSKNINKLSIVGTDHRDIFKIETYEDKEGVERSVAKLRIKFQATKLPIDQVSQNASQTCMEKPNENEQNQFTKTYFQIYGDDYKNTIYQSLIKYNPKTHKYQYQFISEAQLLQLLGDKNCDSVKLLIKPQIAIWLDPCQSTSKAKVKKTDKIFSSAISNTVIALQEIIQNKRELPEPEFSNGADDEGDGDGNYDEQSAEKNKINTNDIPFDEMNFSNIV